MDKNRIVLLGHLGADPKIFNDPSMPTKAVLRVATTMTFKAATGSDPSHTEWHDVVAFDFRAEDARQFKKGDRVYVEGWIKTRVFQSGGSEKRVKEIVAVDLQLIHKLNRTPPPDSHSANPDDSQAATPTPTPDSINEGVLY